jgi:hypothetical protein
MEYPAERRIGGGGLGLGQHAGVDKEGMSAIPVDGMT